MRIAAVLAASALLLPVSGGRERSVGVRRILVLSRTAGFRHDSFAAGYPDEDCSAPKALAPRS